MALTKKQIIEQLASELNRSKKETGPLVETLYELIKKTLERGEDVLVSGFGKFCVKDKPPRRGRNPATGNDLRIDPRRVVTFKCSGKLKTRMNGKD